MTTFDQSNEVDELSNKGGPISTLHRDAIQSS